MNNAKPSESVIKDIHQALRNLDGKTARHRSNLAQAGWLRSSCLLQTRLQQHPTEQYHHALKVVFTRTLEAMEKEAKLYARLLRLRFWEDHTVKRIVSISKELLNQELDPSANVSSRIEQMSRFSSERQVYSLQQEAIGLFALTLWELEALCNKGSTAKDTEISISSRSGMNPALQGKYYEEYGPDDPFGYEIPPTKPSDRQLEILIVTALGLQPTEAGDFLSITANTVRNTLAEIRSELGLVSTLKTFVYVQFRNWITFDDIHAMRNRIREWRESNRTSRKR